MIRAFLVHTLTTILLASQLGLPVHLHYCKGILESASLLFQEGCNDHLEVVCLPNCCVQSEEGIPHPVDNNCCDDEVMVLSQDIISLQPHITKWLDLAFEFTSLPTFEPVSISSAQATDVTSSVIDTSPPRYILHQALIYYA